MKKHQVDAFLESLYEHPSVMWPNVLAIWLSEMLDGERVKKLKTIVCGIKNGIDKNPEEFANFFRSYERISDILLPNLDEESRKRFLLRDIAGFSYLADYDGTGFLTYEMMRGSSRLSQHPFNYPEVYNNFRLYGPAMNAFSRHLRMSGPVLKNFIFDRSPSC